MPDSAILTTIRQLAQDMSTEAFDFLQTLVNSNSFTGNTRGLIDTAELIRTKALEFNLEFTKHPIGEKATDPYHLLCRIPDPGQPYYGLIGHFDTVHHPNSAFDRYQDRGEFIYGPGVQDMKSGLVAMLYSTILLERLSGQKPPFCLLFNCDEETGSRYSRRLIEEEMRHAEAVFVFEGHNTRQPQLVPSRKGITMGRIVTCGRPSHAGEAPQKGISAIIEMAHKIMQLDALNDYPAGRSVTIGRIQGGVTGNQIPERCEVELDVRYTTSSDGTALEEEITSILSQPYLPEARTEFTLEQARPPFVKTAASERLRDLYFAAAADLGQSFGEKSAGGGSDANLTGALGVPTLDGFGCAGEGPHTDHEYILKASLLESIQTFALFFYRLVNT